MNDEAKIWAYAHGELNSTERAQFEAELARNPRLRDEAMMIRRLDGRLRELMPRIDLTAEQLEGQVWQALEQSTAGTPEAGGEPAGILLSFPLLRSLSAFVTRRPRAAWSAVLALAAGLLIVVGLHAYYPAAALEWAPPQFVGPAVRGGEAPPPYYTSAQMKMFQAALQKAVAERWAAHSDRRGQWRLGARFQELANGNFSVQVVAMRAGGGAPAREWARYFQGRQAFREQVDDFAGTIVAELGRSATGQ